MTETPFVLSVVLSVNRSDGSEDAKGMEELLESLSAPDLTPKLPVLLSDNVCLHTTTSTSSSPDGDDSQHQQSFALIFCPSTLVDSALERVEYSSHEEPSSFVKWYPDGQRISKLLLSMLHPFLERNFAIKALVRSCKVHAPADLVLIDLGHSPLSAIADLLDAASSGQMIHSGPERVLKVLLLRSVNVQTKDLSSFRYDQGSETERHITSLDVPETARYPTCPVCLHRIDPLRLRLPKPQATCSRFCNPPNVPSSRGSSWSIACPRQRLLLPWPLPNHCDVCSDIQVYWKRGGASKDYFVCADCGLKETLWVCLTCCFIGCGRYSNKHSIQHNMNSGHPFCLELSTLRIWSYKDGEFAHRIDLLDCPSSLPLLQPLLPDDQANLNTTSVSLDDSRDYHDDYEHRIAAGFSSAVDQLKSPKKAAMIGEEYEALLYSALEDQAQHYKGEISRLQARLAGEQIDKTTMTEDEQRELDRLHHEISAMRRKVDMEAKKLLEARSVEARERETSQRLLKEQQVSKEILLRIRAEIAAEAQQGQMEIEDLEQQIADLTANQRMMQEFSTSDDLRNSQIIGAELSNKSKPVRRSAKKSAKKRR
jgi:Zn-finger in ubiquitin-hydrolases and other protein